MPLTTPHKKEEQKDFIARCMADPTMASDYPDQKQRAAVCYTQWRDAKSSATASKARDFVKSFVRCQLSVTDKATPNILRDVIVCQVGDVHPSTGPEFYLDEAFLDELVKICAGQSRKVRIDHGKGLLSMIGKASGWRKDVVEANGAKLPCVRADIELLDGDAFKEDRERIQTYAEKMPEFFGMSLDMAVQLTKKIVGGLKVAMLAAVDGVDFVGNPAATNSLCEEKVDSTPNGKTMNLLLEAEDLKALGVDEGADEKTVKAAFLEMAKSHAEMKAKASEEDDAKKKKDEEESDKEKDEEESDKAKAAEGEVKKEEEEKAEASKRKGLVTITADQLEEAIAKGTAKVLASHGLKPKASMPKDDEGKSEKASLTAEQKVECSKLGVKEDDYIAALERFKTHS